MFKALVLQYLYNLSDEELEFQIRDRFTFMRFLGLQPESTTPDLNTIWDFRELLAKADMGKSLFFDFELHLQEKGYSARKGQIVDASFVEAPRQRNSREENEAIKKGEVPPTLSQNRACLRHKDLEARWTKKYEVTSAEVHDSQVLLEILTQKQQAKNKAKSKVRARVEHVFGSITNEQDGLHVRVIGILRASTKVGLTNLVYNLRHFTSLRRVATCAAR